MSFRIFQIDCLADLHCDITFREDDFSQTLWQISTLLTLGHRERDISHVPDISLASMLRLPSDQNYSCSLKR